MCNLHIEGGLWERYWQQADLLGTEEKPGPLWESMQKEVTEAIDIVTDINKLGENFVKDITTWQGELTTLIESDNLVLNNINNILSDINTGRKQIFNKYNPQIEKEIQDFDRFSIDVTKAQINQQNYALATNLYNQQVHLLAQAQNTRNWERDAEKFRKSLQEYDIIKQLASSGVLTINESQKIDLNTLQLSTSENMTDEQRKNADWFIVPTAYTLKDIDMDESGDVSDIAENQLTYRFTMDIMGRKTGISFKFIRKINYTRYSTTTYGIS